MPLISVKYIYCPDLKVNMAEFSLEQAMKAQRGIKDIALLFV
jgi:hypothetical protein